MEYVLVLNGLIHNPIDVRSDEKEIHKAHQNKKKSNQKATYENKWSKLIIGRCFAFLLVIGNRQKKEHVRRAPINSWRARDK